MEKIIVRRARRNDSNQFLRLLVELANFEHLEPPSPSARRRIVRDIFDKKKLGLLLAFVSDTSAKKIAAGYALYFYTYSSFLARPTLYLEDLFVSEKFRLRKIGRELFMTCVMEASKKGCGRMEWSVLTWNKNAIRFYEKAGARRLKEWHYYRLDSKALDRIIREHISVP
jgi:GNAT superfamily N-acetyltransferase